MISNWDFSLVLAISELLVDPQQPSSLLDIKLHAFQKAKDLMLQYPCMRRCSFMEERGNGNDCYLFSQQ